MMAPHPTLPESVNDEDLEEERAVIDEMISSLPKGKGWVTHNLYLYKGFWHTHLPLQGAIFAQQKFKARPTDIILPTNPKCGTWLKSIAFAIKNRWSTQTQHLLLTTNPYELILNLEFGIFESYSLREVESLPSPRFFATRIPHSSLTYSVSNLGHRVVYLCREPKDMFVPMWHFLGKSSHKEVPIISLEESFDLFSQGVSHLGPYWNHVLRYYKASLECHERVLFCSSSMRTCNGDTYNHVKRLAEFLGHPFSLEEEAKGTIQEIIQLCSFENMSTLEVNKKGKIFERISNGTFVRKGKVADFKNYLTAETVERLDKIIKENFQGFELGF